MPPGPRDDGDVIAAIERGEIDPMSRPIFGLHGAERYLVDRCLAAIRKAVLGNAGGGASFNHDVFDLKEAPIARVVATARTMPMMAKRRLVVAKGIDEVKAPDLEPLLSYVEDPNPSTCLVLIGEKIDTRFKVFANLRKAGYLHDFPALRDRELAGWLTREARLRKLVLDSDAATTLAEIAGPDLGRLSQALEQLSLYVGETQRIRLEDVETLIAETRQRGVFELTKAIGDGNVERALRLLANMQRNREPALRLQFMLVRQLRQIWRAKELAAAGVSRNEIAGRVGIAPFFLDDVLVPARRMSHATLERSFGRLYRTDRILKSSRIDGDLVMSKLVQQLAEDAGRR